MLFRSLGLASRWLRNPSLTRFSGRIERNHRGCPEAEDVPQQHPVAPLTVEGDSADAGGVRSLPRPETSPHSLRRVRDVRQAPGPRRLSGRTLEVSVSKSGPGEVLPLLTESQARELVTGALGRVLDLAPTTLRDDTPLAGVGADSVALIAFVDVLAQDGGLELDQGGDDVDEGLLRAVTVADLVEIAVIASGRSGTRRR